MRNAKIENDTQLAKKKVKVRIDKIKNELDTLKESLIEKLDSYQNDFKE